MITPAQSAQRRQTDNQAEFEYLERCIDAMLSKPPNTGQEWWFTLIGVNGNTRNRLVDAYRAAGWRVHIVTDQRDGDAMVFGE